MFTRKSPLPKLKPIHPLLLQNPPKARPNSAKQPAFSPIIVPPSRVAYIPPDPFVSPATRARLDKARLLAQSRSHSKTPLLKSQSKSQSRSRSKSRSKSKPHPKVEPQLVETSPINDRSTSHGLLLDKERVQGKQDEPFVVVDHADAASSPRDKSNSDGFVEVKHDSSKDKRKTPGIAKTPGKGKKDKRNSSSPKGWTLVEPNAPFHENVVPKQKNTRTPPGWEKVEGDKTQPHDRAPTGFVNVPKHRERPAPAGWEMIQDMPKSPTQKRGLLRRLGSRLYNVLTRRKALTSAKPAPPRTPRSTTLSVAPRRGVLSGIGNALRGTASRIKGWFGRKGGTRRYSRKRR